jgi:hypothetical protein
MEHRPPSQPDEHPPTHSSAEEDYKAASKSTVDYDQYMPKLRAEHKLIKRIVAVFVAVIIILALGALAYVEGPSIGKSVSNFFSQKSQPKTSTTSMLSSSVATPNRQYSSSIQNLSFNYPSTWKVSESSAEITAKSPAIKLTGYNGQQVAGQVFFTIRSSSTSMSEFNPGNAVAVKPSQTINYTAPAAGQRASTLMSFLNYANAKGSGIDGVYITGSNSYQTGQNAQLSDFASVNPVVAITFAKCSNSQCSGKESGLTISTNSWNNTNFSQPLTDMMTSLVIN